MVELLTALIRDTLAYLKELEPTKPVLFANHLDSIFFQQKAAKLPPSTVPVFSSSPTYIPKKPSPLSPAVSAPVETAKPVPTIPPFSPIQATLQKIAPHFKLHDHVPDDTEAKHLASAWKEKIPNAEVILLACDTAAETLDLLKNLAKAIDQNLAKSKVITADRLEREKRWNLFLAQNQFRLIIASDAVKKLPDLMRYYKNLPASRQSFLDKTPLFILSPAEVYKAIEQKALLWKTLCQMLPKN